MLIIFIPLLIAAYLVGSIPAAYLVTRWRRGIDIRRYGSGNVGASNVFSVVSKRWTVPVTIFDLVKGMLMVWLAQKFGLSLSQQIAAGLLTIIGHNWPLFLGFSGGRGIMSSLGVILMLSPILGGIMLVISFALAPFRLLPLGVSLALILGPFLSWFLTVPLGIEEKLTLTLGLTAIALLAFVRRLTVPRTSFTDRVSRRELIFYRLLFDRDIRDRSTWIKQKPGSGSSADDVADQDDENG